MLGGFPDLYPFGEASYAQRLRQEKQVAFEERRAVRGASRREGASRRVTRHFHSIVGLRFASPNLQFFTKPSVLRYSRAIACDNCVSPVKHQIGFLYM